jgi:hypothetical protein
MSAESLLEVVRNLSSRQISEIIRERLADDRALRFLFRAAVARENERKRQALVEDTDAE